jgi:hypothetical protein
MVRRQQLYGSSNQEIGENMNKMLLFLLCAGWSSTVQPMLEPEVIPAKAGIQKIGADVKNQQNLETQSKDSTEAPLDFKVHQPFLRTFTFKCTKYTLLADGKHFFEIYGKAVNGDPRNEHPILRNFTITLLLTPLSPQIVSVATSIRTNGYIFSVSFAKPANINIQYHYQSTAEANLLDNSITQLFDTALLFERDIIQWFCKSCKERFWAQATPDSDFIINQHYLSDQGQFYCIACGKHHNAQIINSFTIPLDSYQHISSEVELGQRYGGIW